MPSASRAAKRKASPPSRPVKPAKKAAARPAPAKGGKPSKRPAGKPSARPASKGVARPAAVPKVPEAELEVPLPGGRHHVLSLAFVRDGDEFLARLETDSGHITELKNRSLDQLLTLVAGELEDLLE